MKEKILAIAASIAMLTAVDAGSVYWGSDGTGRDGEWSEQDHWYSDVAAKVTHLGRIPTSSDTFYPVNGADYTLTLNNTYDINYMQVIYSGKITLAGSGTLQEHSGVYTHMKGGTSRILEISDEVTYNANLCNQYSNYGGKLIVSGGEMNIKGYACETSDCITVISGGVFNNTAATYTNGNELVVSAGSYNLSSKYTSLSLTGTKVEVSGGLLSANGAIVATGASTVEVSGMASFGTTKTITFSDGASMRISGSPTITGTAKTFNDGTVLEIAEGARVNMGKLVMTGGATLKIGAGAVLTIAHDSSVKCDVFEMDPTASIEISVGEVAAVRSTPIMVYPGIDVTEMNISLSAPDGWKMHKIRSTVFVTGGVETTATAAYEWTGAVGGNWSTPGNWHGGAVPNGSGSDVNVYISGERNTVITNDVDDLEVWSIEVRAGTAPVLIRGKTLKIKSSESAWAESNNLAVRNYSSNPLTFECPVKMTTTAPQSAVDQRKDTTGYVCFANSLDASGQNNFYLTGRAYFGTTTLRCFKTQSWIKQFVGILPNSTFTLSNQSSECFKTNYPGTVSIAQGATFVTSKAFLLFDTLEFDGGAISVAGDALAAVGKEWTTVISTKAITGTPKVAGDYHVRIVDDEVNDGFKLLQLRTKDPLMLFLR